MADTPSGKQSIETPKKAPELSSWNSPQNKIYSAQLLGPLPFKLYSLFIKHIMHNNVPSEEELIAAGMTATGDGMSSIHEPRLSKDGSTDSDSTPQKCSSASHSQISRTKMFVYWAKKMYVSVNKKNPEKPVVSLLVRKTQREIIPKESFHEVVMKIHSANGSSGEKHLPLHATVAGVKREYAYGRRDFGMTEGIIRDIILQCGVKRCYVSEYGMAFKTRKLLKTQRKTSYNERKMFCYTTGLSLESAKYYTEVAEVIIHSFDEDKKTPEEIQANEKKLSAVRQAASISLNGGCLKRKAGGWSDEKGADPFNPYDISAVNDVDFELAFSGITKNAVAMRKQFVKSCVGTGSRASYDSLCRSMNTVEMLLHRCKTLMNKRVRHDEDPKPQ